MIDVPCPFIYSNGRRCAGRIVRVEAYKAELQRGCEKDGWVFGFAERSHFHLFCSEKGNHAGYARGDDIQMKFRWRELPTALREMIETTQPRLEKG